MTILASEGFFKNPRQIFGGDADAVVGDSENGFAVLRGSGDLDGFTPILDTIEEDLV